MRLPPGDQPGRAAAGYTGRVDQGDAAVRGERAGPYRLVGLWALAEATVWPIMPDAALAPLAAARPAAWWRLAAVAAAGSALGGLLSYLVGRWRPVEPLLARLPLVRPPMAAAATRWLADEGSAGLRHQPLSGLPFKVFALLAGRQRQPLLGFLAWAVLVRGLRFLAVAGGAALLGARCEGLVRRRGWPLALLWGLAFLLGLRHTVGQWERRGQPA